MISVIENKILEVLKENFSEFEVASFPVGFEKYHVTSPKGAALVRFENALHQVQDRVCAVYSNTTYNFTIFFCLRYAHRHNEAYSYLNKFKSVLNGLEILHKRLLVNKTDFEAEIEGDLWYSLTTSIELPIIDENKNFSIANEELDKLFSNA